MSLFDSVKEKLFRHVDGEAPAKMESVQDQPPEDIALCSFVKQKLEESRSQANRVASEGTWMTNIAYLSGFDSCYYNTATRQFLPMSGAASLKRNRVRSNLLLPAAQNRLARMLKSSPKYDVIPNSEDQEDKEAAELGIEQINDVWDRQHINRKRIDLGMWKQQCGHAYGKISVDDQLGPEMTDPETGEFVGFEGDIRFDVVSAFEGFPDPLAKTFDECSWFIQAKVRKLDYFRTRYKLGYLVKEEGAWLLSAQYEMRINAMNASGGSGSGGTEQMKNSAIEISYYEKRSNKHRNGRHIVVANGVLLKNDKLPFGEIPFAKFDDVIIGGKYNSEALITHARPILDQFNEALKRRGEWVRKMLAGKYIAERSSGLAQEALNDQNGEVVLYDLVPGAPEPHAMQIPVIPAYAYTETDDLRKQFYEIMQLSEISRGHLPSASIPAEGMQILLEQDETTIGVEVEADEHSWARIGMLILKATKACYTSERDIKKRTSSGFAIRKVSGERLRNNLDVRVVRGSTLPNSKVMKRQEILNAYERGFMGDPNDPAVREEVWGMLQYGDIHSKGWEDYRVNMHQIQKTIDQIEMAFDETDAPIVDMKDDHPLHLKVKNRYRKSDKWELLSDLQKQMFQNDMAEHTAWAAKLSNPALMTPPDPGPPPPSMEEALAMDGITDTNLKGPENENFSNV